MLFCADTNPFSPNNTVSITCSNEAEHEVTFRTRAKSETEVLSSAPVRISPGYDATREFSCPGAESIRVTVTIDNQTDAKTMRPPERWEIRVTADSVDWGG
jgi:hypothetical protein